MVAEVLSRFLAGEGMLTDLVIGLGIAAASKASPALKRNHRFYRRIRSLMNHDWLSRQIGFPGARQFYEELEPFMNWDHHYWLQRGSLELENGDLQLAENFLNQSYGLESQDPLVQTEVGYLRLRFAIAEPSSAESRRLLSEGFDLLQQAIYSRHSSDPHQYHIYVKMGLEWLRRSDIVPIERERLLIDLSTVVEAGRQNHPRDEGLREAYVAVQNARLGHD